LASHIRGQPYLPAAPELSRPYLVYLDVWPPEVGNPPVSPNEDINQRIVDMARKCVGLPTADVPGTNHGRLACAWAVNEVARRALGKPVGGGLSTADMYAVLKSHDSAVNMTNIRGGEIVISPTTGTHVGHVGIVGPKGRTIKDTKIYSNSSSLREFEQNYTIASWKAYFSGKDLPVLFFDLDKRRF
jgi:hypothetical protein